MAQRMQAGLLKLVEAAASVEILKTELLAKVYLMWSATLILYSYLHWCFKQNVIIEEATAAAEVVLQEVKVSADAAEVIKAQVSEIKAAAEQLVSAIAVDTELALGKLAKAKPALDEAEAALNVSITLCSRIDLDRI